MQVKFYKYQGTGNDFVLIDNRDMHFDSNNAELVKQLCDRRFGIGADGLMCLQNKNGFDFEMIYLNADGKPSSMCGNGGRCIVSFAKKLQVIDNKAHFIAVDGPHNALVANDWVSLKMNDVNSIETGADFYYLNTGSPHYVTFVNNVNNINVFEKGRAIRYNERFKAEGTNVNFIEREGDLLIVRTYERGVENETYSCGTGVTAAALVAAITNNSTSSNSCKIKTLGGQLLVKFDRDVNNTFSNIWLEGPANFVFEGSITL